MQDLESLLALFTRLKVSVATEKVEGPSTRLTFLGIEIDTSSMSLRLPSEKLSSLKLMVADWLHKKSCRIQDLQSLVGKLQHACKVVRPGRTFLRRMFELLKGRPRDQQFVCLGMPFRLDLRWWHMFLESWNGTGLLQGQRLGPTDFNLITDASGSFGAGAWFNGYWFQLRTLATSGGSEMVNFCQGISTSSNSGGCMGATLAKENSTGALR